MFIKGIAKHIKKFTLKISTIVAKWVHQVLFLDTAGEIVKISKGIAVWTSGIALLISLGVYVLFRRIFSAEH